MLCVYKGNGKKFTDLNLKEIRDEAEKKNGASALHQTPSGDYFLSFEIET